jgi:hypothetical protein
VLGVGGINKTYTTVVANFYPCKFMARVRGTIAYAMHIHWYTFKEIETNGKQRASGAANVLRVSAVRPDEDKWGHLRVTGDTETW